jgi:predicted nuclease with TOPRIM domain
VRQKQKEPQTQKQITMEELKNKWQDRIDHYKQLKATTIDRFENYELPASEYQALKHKLKSLDDGIELCSEFLTDLSK